MNHPKRFPASVIGVAVALASGQALALDIVPTFVDSPGLNWTDQDGLTRRNVVEQAIAEWEAKITDAYTLPMTFDYTNAGTGGYLGQFSGGYSGVYVGDDVYPWSSTVTRTIHFNASLIGTNPNYLWFDPTPSTSNDQPFAAWDALSVTRHELAHALGFSTLFRTDVGEPGQTIIWSSHISGGVFDPGGLNVTMASGDASHVADSVATHGDLMVQALVNGTRRPISSTDANMLQVAYGYTLASAYLAGDTTPFDGVVNLTDLNAVLNNFGGTGPTNGSLAGDTYTFDGTVNLTDLNAVLNNFGATGPGPIEPLGVPEPASAIPIALGALTLGRRSGRGSSRRS